MNGEENGLEAAIGIEPMHKGFAGPCLTTWLRRPARENGRGGPQVSVRLFANLLAPARRASGLQTGAGDGIRTRDIQLGKLTLYH